jgi:hypothetical protein
MTYTYLPTYLFRFGSEWLSTRHDLTNNATLSSQEVIPEVSIQAIDREGLTNNY